MRRNHHRAIAIAILYGLAAALWPTHPAWRRYGCRVGRV